jgi:hypothetical protein
MIQAPDLHIAIGGLPAVRCYRCERAEGRVCRFDIVSDEHFGISAGMLRDWFEKQGFGNEDSAVAARLCVTAAEALA